MSKFSKVYKSGHLAFKVEAEGAHIDLIRLPVVDDAVHASQNGSHSYPQMCMVFLKETLTADLMGWSDGPKCNELIKDLSENAGPSSKRYVVSEYVGREGSSENLSPDTALDGFLEWELDVALQAIDKDEELYKYLIACAIEKIILVK